MTTALPKPKPSQKQLRRDLRVLGRFINIYCQNEHAELPKEPVTIKTHDIHEIMGKDLHLCENCSRLLVHAWTKRSHCPMNPKPMCKHCPKHCYHPDYRAQIQKVMRHSGRKMILGGRLDYLLHFFL